MPCHSDFYKLCVVDFENSAKICFFLWGKPSKNIYIDILIRVIESATPWTHSENPARSRNIYIYIIYFFLIFFFLFFIST